MTIQPGVYKHYKGKKYKVYGMAKHAETMEDLVVYETLYHNPISKLWVRPAKKFLEKINHKDKFVQRFTFIHK